MRAAHPHRNPLAKNGLYIVLVLQQCQVMCQKPVDLLGSSSSWVLCSEHPLLRFACIVLWYRIAAGSIMNGSHHWHSHLVSDLRGIRIPFARWLDLYGNVASPVGNCE